MKISKTEHFNREGFSGDLYLSAKENKGFNALRVSVHGKHPLKRVIDTTRVYFIVDGTGVFIINKKIYEAKKNDLFIIESGDEYEYEGGNMNLFEFNILPSNSFKD